MKLFRLSFIAFLSTLSLVVLWASQTHCDTIESSQPNIVMILSDDQAWTDFGFMGHPSIETPRLDELARDSLVFTHGYVPSSLCRPSLASLITGLAPHQHGITCNDPPLPRGAEFERLREAMIANIDKVNTLPRMLGELGYFSMQAGKWWEGPYGRGGFTHGMTHGDPRRGGRHGDDGLKIGREGMAPITQFLDAAGDRPFFLWYAPMLPHAPHNPPERLLAKYQVRTESIHLARYWAMCEWFDETVGELLDALRARHQEHKTIVVFVTDNGWIQSVDKPEFAPRSKRSPYDAGLRTPIMIRWPGVIAPAVDATPVLSTDIAPTILTLLGHNIPPQMEGINLVDPNARAARPAVCGAVFAHNAVDVTQPVANVQYRWIRSGGWKMIVRQRDSQGQDSPAFLHQEGGNPGNAGPVELYQLDADPHELQNLADQRPLEVELLNDLLRSWWPEGAAVNVGRE